MGECCLPEESKDPTRSRKDMEVSVREVRVKDAGRIVNLLNPIIQNGTYTVMDARFSVEDQIEFIRAFPERGI